jgi:hypothetical protein
VLCAAHFLKTPSLTCNNLPAICQMLAGTCMEPGTDELEVPDSLVVLELLGEGNIQYFCQADGTVKTDYGEGWANVRSPDGVWVGTFEYPIDGIFTGMPTWNLTNQVTGEVRVIHGDSRNQAKKESPDGYEMAWTRRIMFGDDSTLDREATAADVENGLPTLPRWDNKTFVPAGPKTRYVIRSDTYVGEKPAEGTRCLGAGGDYWVPFTAKYTFLSCDFWLLDYATYLPGMPIVAPMSPPPPVPPPVVAPPPPAPIPLPAPVLAPEPEPEPEPVPATTVPAVQPQTTVPPPTSAPATTSQSTAASGGCVRVGGHGALAVAAVAAIVAVLY